MTTTICEHSKETILKNINTKKLLEELTKHLKNLDTRSKKQVIKAIEWVVIYHEGQVRASGKPYHTHPIIVAKIISEIGLDVDSIITALLHDILEDTVVSKSMLKDAFGPTITNLVEGVTKLTQIHFASSNINQAENFRKFFLAMSKDIRVLLVKLADRLHNMRTIDYVACENKRKSKALETIEIYAPLAERIGMQKVKNELQDICFKVLKPQEYKKITDHLNHIKCDQISFINSIVDSLSRKLKEEVNVEAQIHGRIKTPYSISTKMDHKKITMEELSDIIAFRIIVPTTQDCYMTLYAIHKYYKMVPETFSDFISTPKNNGYSSLHTVVLVPSGYKIEVQIRTQQMHDVAERGLAAHWQYKQYYNSMMEGVEYAWIRELLDILNTSSNMNDFLSHTKMSFYHHEVFCFTPKGSLKVLPRKANVIDFAYAVRPDIGNHCAQAKINGAIMLIYTKLNNGDQVEIITDPQSHPIAEWQNNVVTAKAHAEIKKYLRIKQRYLYIDVGKKLFYESLKLFKNADPKATLHSAMIISEKYNDEDLFYAIGSKDIEINQLLKKSIKIKQKDLNLNNHMVTDASQNKYLPIKCPIEGISLEYATCCHPLPGDNIAGMMASDSQALVHTTDCMATHFSSGKLINLSWNEKALDHMHDCDVLLLIKNQIGSFAAFAGTIFKSGGNISDIKILNKSNELIKLKISVSTKDKEHFHLVITNLKKLKKTVNILSIL